MKAAQFIEKHFWLFFLSGMALGLWYPVCNDFLMSMLKGMLMMMLFLVFLKTDIAHILSRMKNFKFMAFIVMMNMVIVPVALYFVVRLFDASVAVGILLLTAMPAGVASPALTDIVKGNTALSASIVIVTSLIAPLTVPLLFWAIEIRDLSIDSWWLFRDLAMFVFIPIVASQPIKKYASGLIAKNMHVITSGNIFILMLMVYTVMGSQREVILDYSINILWQVGLLYLIFVALHVIGYFTGFAEDLQGKIATTIGSAYMNNGMAIVLAAIYFEPSILILMVLSEFPWNTLLIPFKKYIQYHKRKNKIEIN